MPALTPPRRLVGLYLLTAHTAFALGLFLTAWNPSAVAGFFYHSRMVALVHLVTIGWIAMSILGCLYIVLPMVCGVALPVRRADYVAFGFAVFGLAGMVVHFWIAEFSGMAWSAIAAALAMLHVMTRAALAVRGARIATGVKLHIYLAAANLVAAVTMGVLLGFDKVYAFLPGYVLTNVFAHAHIAALGWATMLVLGFGYRLLPIVLPSAMPSGRSISVSAILLEAGTLGLFVTLVTRSSLAPFFALTIVSAFIVFGVHVWWMLRHPARVAPQKRDADFAVHYIAAVAVYLLLACACGLALVIATPSELSMRVALLYGVLGLVGFLAQSITAFERRILPMVSTYWAVERYGKPVDMTSTSAAVSMSIAAGWLSGVPLVAVGLFATNVVMLTAGSWLLFGAVLLSGVDLAGRLSVLRSAPPHFYDFRKNGV